MHRVGFRIAAVFALVQVFPFPLGTIPGTRGLEELLDAPMTACVLLLARVLGLPQPSTAPTGSGDTLFAYLHLLLAAIVAVGSGLAWSALARERHSYPRLASALRVGLRYWLGLAMVIYGLVKVFPLQFDLPHDVVFDQRVGDKSPMGLLWLFMGYSRPYTIFAGLCELVSGVLLMWRRTTTIGALVAAAVMTNIVLLNFCYDVPVKLYSLELLIAAIAIAAPDLRRLITAALGRATLEVPPRIRSSIGVERARFAVKLGLLGACAVGWCTALATVEDDRPPPSELAGAWDVTAFALDGVDHPPLATDGERWSRAIFARGGLIVRLMPETRVGYRARVDEMRKTIELANVIGERELWTYTRPDAEHLVLDGSRRGRNYHVVLTRAPASLLETRGFHWIQEQPFHR